MVKQSAKVDESSAVFACYCQCDVQVVEWLLVSNRWSGRGRRKMPDYCAHVDWKGYSYVAQIWYIVGRFEAIVPTKSTRRKGMVAHMHTACAKFVYPRSSWREERLLLAQLKHAVVISATGKTGNRFARALIWSTSTST